MRQRNTSRQRLPLTPEAALIRMESLCSRSERSTAEIRTKLRSLNVTAGDAEKIIKSLTERRFIDDARFARMFARDKLVYGGYGRYRISLALRQKGISTQLITEAINEIDSDTYIKRLDSLIESKAARMPELESYESRNKIYRYAATRGFESDLIIPSMKRVLQRISSREQ